MKKRAFEDAEREAPADEEAPAPPARTEPAPLARTAIALVVLSWLVPLGMLVSILHYTELEPSTRILHRMLSISSLTLWLSGLGVAGRSIAIARKSPTMRRRLAVSALLLGLLTPVVWASELLFAWELYVARENLDAAEAESDATSPAAE